MVDFVNDVLSSIHGTGFIGMDTRTVLPGLLGGKSNPHKGRVIKITTGSNVMAMTNKKVNGYDAMIRRRLEAEGKDPASFELGPRAWGERIKGLPLVRHEKDGKVFWYFEVIFVKAGEVTYEFDGKPINKHDIIGMPAKAPEGEQGGLDNKVILRTYGLDTITRLRIAHRQFLPPFEVRL